MSTKKFPLWWCVIWRFECIWNIEHKGLSVGSIFFIQSMLKLRHLWRLILMCSWTGNEPSCQYLYDWHWQISILNRCSQAILFFSYLGRRKNHFIKFFGHPFYSLLSWADFLVIAQKVEHNRTHLQNLHTYITYTRLRDMTLQIMPTIIPVSNSPAPCSISGNMQFTIMTTFVATAPLFTTLSILFLLSLSKLRKPSIHFVLSCSKQ